MTIKKDELAKLKEIYSTLEVAKGELEDIYAEAKGRYDARSEKWRESDDGERIGEEIEKITEAADDVDRAFDALANITGIIE